MDNNTLIKKDAAKKIAGTLLEVEPKQAKTLINQLICEFYSQDVEPEIVEDIFREVTLKLHNNPSKDYELDWITISNYMDSIYMGETKPNDGLFGAQFLLNNNYDKATATEYNTNLKAALKHFEKYTNHSEEVGTNRVVQLNEKDMRIEYITYDLQGNPYKETVINAYPHEIIIHDSPLDDIGRTFTIRWKSKTSERIFDTTRQSIKEIESYLEDAGWVITPRRLKGILAAVLHIAVSHKLAKMKNEIDNPGVYYDKDKEIIKLINYEIHEPKENELVDAFEVVELLGSYFKGNETKLATILKWGLMSIFGYSIKQAGGPWMPWLYLFGKAGSGKSTLGKIILFLHDIPNENNEIGGSNFDTVARIGNRVSQFTLPLLVNEPEGAFNKPSVQAMIKSSIESTVARGKYQGKQYRNIPSFTTCCVTANPPLPPGDALHRRFMSIMFSHNEKKTKEDKDNFDRTFKIKSPKYSVLNRLKALSNFFIYEIKANPNDFLSMEWKETSNLLLTRLYTEYGREIPEWLLGWHESETLDELDDEEREEIRLFFMEQINKATQKVQVWDEETGRPKNDTLTDNNYKTSKEFEDRVFTVLNEHLVPYMGLHVTKNGEQQVYFTSGLKKQLSKVTSTNYNLKSVAELLEWPYKSVKLPKPTKVMIVNFDDFLGFVYPDLVEVTATVSDDGFEEVVL